jgi:hypothetical protein
MGYMYSDVYLMNDKHNSRKINIWNGGWCRCQTYSFNECICCNFVLSSFHYLLITCLITIGRATRAICSSLLKNNSTLEALEESRSHSIGTLPKRALMITSQLGYIRFHQTLRTWFFFLKLEIYFPWQIVQTCEHTWVPSGCSMELSILSNQPSCPYPNL